MPTRKSAGCRPHSSLRRFSADNEDMRKQAAVVFFFVLVFAGVGSSALAQRSTAHSQQSAALREEKRLGPKPLPRWYWRWVEWRLGEGYAKRHALQPHLRPTGHLAPCERWAWHRLHYFLLARPWPAAATGGPEREGRGRMSGQPPTRTGGPLYPKAHCRREQRLPVAGSPLEPAARRPRQGDRAVHWSSVRR